MVGISIADVSALTIIQVVAYLTALRVVGVCHLMCYSSLDEINPIDNE